MESPTPFDCIVLGPSCMQTGRKETRKKRRLQTRTGTVSAWHSLGDVRGGGPPPGETNQDRPEGRVDRLYRCGPPTFSPTTPAARGDHSLPPSRRIFESGCSVLATPTRPDPDDGGRGRAVRRCALRAQAGGARWEPRDGLGGTPRRGAHARAPAGALAPRSRARRWAVCSAGDADGLARASTSRRGRHRHRRFARCPRIHPRHAPCRHRCPVREDGGRR